MADIPQDSSWESTLALRADPYRFIGERCRRYRSDVFEARIFLQTTICLSGRDAAALFYDPARFMRRGAAPEPLANTLLGPGGVQATDGETHRRRKAMFLSLMTPERTARLVGLVVSRWRAYGWSGRVVLYDALHEILTRAACEWAGVPLPEADVRRRTWELTALFDGAGSIGLRHLWARLARWRADDWAEGLVRQAPSGTLRPPEGSALAAVAAYRDPDGELPARVAGVELLNVLRPVVAVSVFLTFAAVALHQYPECRDRVLDGEPEYAEWFAQEVRRFFPFFPAAAARVREDFEWQGYRFRKGRRALLDLYGTDHDERVWGDPAAFRPERFRGRADDPFGFIPQGAGEHAVTHRCAGERPTVELIKASAGLLAGGMAYDVPEQDLTIDMARLPALPRSRFAIENVRVLGPVPAVSG